MRVLTAVLSLTLGLQPMPATSPSAAGATGIRVVRTPPSAGGNRHYVSNRPPLAPSPLIKLPIGSIAPRGWLLGQLERMRDGFVGHLPEVSKFCRDDSGWLTGKGVGWEEVPYWLKGFGDLGYVLNDERIVGAARKWLDAAIKTQQDDGWFGPPPNKQSVDLWPNMIMLFALQSLHEFDGDPGHAAPAVGGSIAERSGSPGEPRRVQGDARVVPLMTKYFRYLYELPPEKLFADDWGVGEYKPTWWQDVRAGDNIESVYWLYNRTGDPWLLDLAQRMFERAARWKDRVIGTHGVNICMGFRQPGVFWQQAKDDSLLAAVERNYRTVMDEYGQQPGGMFAADENLRPGKTDPRYAAETCSMVEFMYSNESLLKITGDSRYADRCEEIAFNSLPASMTADLKGLHYLTAANQVVLDEGDHCFENQGTMVSYDPWRYRCCQHNVAFGWPYFAEHLWMATPGNGLAAVMYAPCEVSAKVADGAPLRITERTDYPFDGTVEFTISCGASVSFPLTLRIPGWCKQARLAINGEPQSAELKPEHFAIIERAWTDGDQVRLELPMSLTVRQWSAKAANSVSIYRGPLAFSLKIGERWAKCGGKAPWWAYEVHPTTPWNYALVLDPQNPGATVTLSGRHAVGPQPFTPDDAPVGLTARARRIPGWKLEKNDVGELPTSPIRSDEAIEDVVLIPMGCARLRVSAFAWTTP